uniref:Uncharacterized protein n=1 Tax=Acrobeloides nanus TaxID=290746 RepID=A0A914DI73_9BILA
MFSTHFGPLLSIDPSTFFNENGIFIPKAVREIIEVEKQGGPISTSIIPDTVIISYEVLELIEQETKSINLGRKPSPISIFNFVQWHLDKFPTFPLIPTFNSPSQEPMPSQSGLKRKAITENKKVSQETSTPKKIKKNR